MSVRPVVQPVTRPVTQPPFQLAGFKKAFSPAELFLSGEQGVWLDPSDLSTMFQDPAGTIPVTAAGQPVGLIRDKSGNNNHLTRTIGERPILQVNGSIWNLVFDGSNDHLISAPINFTATSSMSVFASMGKFNDVAARVLVELGQNVAANNGSFALLAPDAAAAETFRLQCKGTIQSDILASGYPFWTTYYAISALCSIGVSQRLRVNGVNHVGDALQGSGNFGNYPLNVGMRNDGTLSFRGYLMGLVVRGAVSTPEEISKIETWLGAKAGIVL